MKRKSIEHKGGTSLKNLAGGSVCRLTQPVFQWATDFPSLARPGGQEAVPPVEGDMFSVSVEQVVAAVADAVVGAAQLCGG